VEKEILSLTTLEYITVSSLVSDIARWPEDNNRDSITIIPSGDLFATPMMTQFASKFLIFKQSYSNKHYTLIGGFSVSLLLGFRKDTTSHINTNLRSGVMPFPRI
jgi:hypothetical protein